MKKIFRNMLALAVAAFVFNACEDVPEPYPVPENGGGDTPEVQTLGTADAPLTTAAALDLINALSDNATSEQDAYVKGKVVKIVTTASQFEQYGNINYYISDDGSDNNTIYVYAGDGLAGNFFTSVNDIKAGDEVVVFGKLQKYVNSSGRMTPEIAKGNYIIKLTAGNETPDNPSPTEVKAVTIAEFNAAAESDDVWYQLTGTVKNLKDGDQYGNFDLEDETGSVYVYGVLSEKGGAKKLFQELVAKYDIKNGSKLTIIGTRGSYNGKIEVMNAYFVSIEGGSNGNNETNTSLNVDFKANGQGNWSIIDTKELGEGITYVWTYDSKYGMKASAYVSGTRHETDSWLISRPAINLANEGTLTFSHTQRYGSGSDLHVMVSTTYTGGSIDVSQWSEVSIDQWPDGSSWNFITSTGKIPAGSNIHIAFRYTSSTTTAATWEIESLSVK